MILAALLVSVSMISTASPNLSVVVVVVVVSGGACRVGGVGCVGMVTSTVSSPIVTERSSTATATATLVFWRWVSIRSATCWLDSVVRWMPSFLSMRDLSFSRSSRDMRLSLSLPSSLVFSFMTSLSWYLFFICTAYMGGAWTTAYAVPVLARVSVIS